MWFRLGRYIEFTRLVTSEVSGKIDRHRMKVRSAMCNKIPFSRMRHPFSTAWIMPSDESEKCDVQQIYFSVPRSSSVLGSR
jgi:hypothetical protein